MNTMKAIENCATGRLRIVHNPKPEQAIHQDPSIPDEFRGLFAQPGGDWDVVAPDGRIIESCPTEAAARQTAGFYGFIFGM